MYIYVRNIYIYTYIFKSTHTFIMYTYMLICMCMYEYTLRYIARTCTHRQTWRSACTDISVGELGSQDQWNKQSKCAGSIEQIHARKPSNTGLIQPILTTPGSRTGLCYMFIQVRFNPSPGVVDAIRFPSCENIFFIFFLSTKWLHCGEVNHDISAMTSWAGQGVWVCWRFVAWSVVCNGAAAGFAWFTPVLYVHRA